VVLGSEFRHWNMLDRLKDNLFGVLEFMSKERSNGQSTNQTIIMFERCKERSNGPSNDQTIKLADCLEV
jgi:hypothetical protein